MLPRNVATSESSGDYSARKVKQRVSAGKDLVSAPCLLEDVGDEKRLPTNHTVLQSRSQSLPGKG